MDEQLPFRLGILAPGDPDNVLTWSGVPHFMVKALRKHFREVVYLPAGSLNFTKRGMRIDHWSRRLFGRGLVPGHSRRDLARRARAVDQRIEAQGIDVVLAITVAQLVAFLQTGIPLVHHSDTTFAAMEGYYPEYSRLWAFSRARGNDYASRAITRANLCTFPSHWAARSAIKDYGAESSKVYIVPYGANVTEPPSSEEALRRRRGKTCQLLFMGRPWERKGGETAYAAFLELLDRGMNARLVVVGCNPGVSHDRLEVIPYLNKQIPDELERYNRLWRESAFLFMPSRQETFGAVFAEAASNGLPVVSRRTGGIPDAVEDGVTGHLLPEDAGPEAYADVIEANWEDRDAYEKLVRGARKRFERELNWDAWARRTTTLIETLVST